MAGYAGVSFIEAILLRIPSSTLCSACICGCTCRVLLQQCRTYILMCCCRFAQTPMNAYYSSLNPRILVRLFYSHIQAVDFRTRWFGQTTANALGTALGNLLGPAPRADVTASTSPKRRASAPSSTTAPAQQQQLRSLPSPALRGSDAATAASNAAVGATATPTKAPAWASALRAVWVPSTPLRLVRLCLRGEPGARLGVAAAACVRHLAGNLSLRVKK